MIYFSRSKVEKKVAFSREDKYRLDFRICHPFSKNNSDEEKAIKEKEEIYSETYKRAEFERYKLYEQFKDYLSSKFSIIEKMSYVIDKKKRLCICFRLYFKEEKRIDKLKEFIIAYCISERGYIYERFFEQ